MIDWVLSTPVCRLHLAMFYVIIRNICYLLGYFEFLHGQGIICLPLNNNIDNMSSKKQKRQILIAFIIANTIQYPRTLMKNIYRSNKRGPPPFFHPDTNPLIGHAVVHSVEKTHVLVVTLELIWFMSLSFNFVPTLRKCLSLTRFRKSYVNHPVVVLANHCQSYIGFFQMSAVQRGPWSFFSEAVCFQ